MTVLVFAARHWAVILALTLVSYGLGRTLLWRLPFRSTGEKIGFSASLGLGLIGTTLFLLGLARLLYVGVVAAAAVLVVAASWRAWREMASWAGDGSLRRRLAAAGVAAAVVAPLAIMPLYPPHLWDAISYHLPAAKLYATGHAVVPAEHLRFCVFPQLNEMLFALMLMVSDDLSAQFVQFAAMVLVAVLLYGWCGARYSRMAGVWTAALWLSNPQVVALAAVAYVDVGVTLFSTVAIFAWVNAMDEDAPGWAALSGAGAGFAAASKYTALVIVTCLLGGLLVRAVRRRSGRAVVAFSVCCAAVAGPWYAHNLHRTGNPVFPFMRSVFPNRACWSEADSVLVDNEMRTHGGPRTLRAALRLPYALAFENRQFVGPEGPSKLLALALPLFLVGALRDPRTRWLGAVALAFLAFWFLSVQIFRYLLPIIPVVGALVVLAVDWALARRMRGLRHAAVIEVAVALLIMAQSYRLAWAVGTFEPPPVTPREKDLYHQRVPSFRCFQWLNDHHGSRYRVYTIGEEFMTYYTDGIRIGDAIGPARYADLPMGDAEGLYTALRSHRADFLLVNDPRLLRGVEVQPFFRRHFQLVCGCADTRVWRLVDEAPAIGLGPEMIRNGAFVAEARGWKWVGPPAIQPARGDGAAHVTASQYPEQRLPVAGDRLHRFAFAAGGQGARSPRVSFLWFDSDRQLVARETQLFRIDDGGSTGEMYVTSPRTASHVRISLLPSPSDGTAVFDDVSLRQVLVP